MPYLSVVAGGEVGLLYQSLTAVTKWLDKKKISRKGLLRFTVWSGGEGDRCVRQLAVLCPYSGNRER